MCKDEHKIPIEELYQRWGVKPETGLSLKEAQNRQKEFGSNILTPKKRSGGGCFPFLCGGKKSKQDKLEEIANSRKRCSCLRDGEWLEVSPSEVNFDFFQLYLSFWFI